jgi:DedD protein
MAFFKFRKGGDETPAPAPAVESVEAMRTRARHRLIGASVLVLLGVIGFPLLFDSQPRPIAVDIPIEIPDKATVKPLTVPSVGKPAPDTVAPAPKPAAAPAVAPSRASTGSVAGPAPVTAAKPAIKAEAKPETKPVEKPADKPAEKPAPRADDGAKARALLEGKTEEKPATAAVASSRFVVQIGAYSDVAKAHEARVKLEKAGLKTYTQVVQPKEGKRIRVRVGPFESKAEADKVAEKIRKLDLPAAILEL